MKPIVINYLVLLLFISCSAQKIEKKTVFIKFEAQKNCDEKLKFFYQKENGTVFNLFCNKNESLLYKNGSLLYKKGADTLNLNELKKYKISSIEEIEKIEKQWRIDNKKALIKKFGKLYPPFNKNGIFKTYLIEILDDKRFVIYPVEWRNLDVID